MTSKLAHLGVAHAPPVRLRRMKEGGAYPTHPKEDVRGVLLSRSTSDIMGLVKAMEQSGLVRAEVVNSLKSKNPHVRANAASAIGFARLNGCEMPEAVKPLARVLANRDVKFIAARREAADALAIMDSLKDDVSVAIGALIIGTEYRDNVLRGVCRKLLAGLEQKGKLTRREKERVAELDRSRGLIEDTRELLSSYLPEKYEKGIALVIGNEAARKEAVRLLSDHNPETRERAALALGRVARQGVPMPQGAVEALAHLIANHAEVYIRAAQHAAFALEEMALHGQDIRAAMGVLNSAWDNETDMELRFMCNKAYWAAIEYKERQARLAMIKAP